LAERRNCGTMKGYHNNPEKEESVAQGKYLKKQ
jgi:hypothetical protein